MKKVLLLIFVLTTLGFVLSNPNCPTGYTTAPALNSTTTRNCTSCHGDYSLNTTGGGIIVTGLPSIYNPGQAYSFSIKINHATANRTIWGFSIKAIDTATHAVIGTWTSSNANTSIKGSAGGSSYELSHANAATSSASNTYTYSNLIWTAPSTPTAVQNTVKFYIAAVAGNNNSSESGDYVYTTNLTSIKYVSTTPTLPTSQVITQSVVAGVCDTLRTFSVPAQSGVSYAWSISGTGNYIVSGQGNNSIRAVTKSAGTASVTLSNSVGSIPTVSSTFTRALPPAPNTLVGSTAPCPNSTFTYTTSSLAPTASQVAVSKYRWTIPVGCSITSANSDSSSVNINFGSSFTTGSVSVKSESACGIVSGSKILAVAPAKPIDLVSSTGFWNACIGNSVIYSVVSATVNTGSIYRWTKPAGTTIVSANGDSSVITLSFITGYRGGALTVKSSTSCGALGTVFSKTLTHINCAAGSRIGVEELQEDLIALYPIPNNGNFTFNVQTAEGKTAYANISILDVAGRIVYTNKVKMIDGIFGQNFNLNLQRGMYVFYYIVGDKRKTITFIVQ